MVSFLVVDTDHYFSRLCYQVSNTGVIRCIDAKHPVLLLRRLQNTTNSDINNSEGTAVAKSDTSTVVGNSFELTSEAPALIISGPNAGGKTIVLKVKLSVVQTYVCLSIEKS